MKALQRPGSNQQKADHRREVDLSSDLLIAVQPTRGLDVGAIEYIRKELLAQRDGGQGGSCSFRWSWTRCLKCRIAFW